MEGLVVVGVEGILPETVPLAVASPCNRTLDRTCIVEGLVVVGVEGKAFHRLQQNQQKLTCTIYR